MKRTAGRDCPSDGRAFKVLAGREKSHDRTGMTGFDSGIRTRTISVGLRRANHERVGLDRPEIAHNMQNARHGNGHHTGNPDQGPKVANSRKDSMEHDVEHAALKVNVEFSSMGMKAHAGTNATNTS
jgi:hypothetical protein